MKDSLFGQDDDYPANIENQSDSSNVSQDSDDDCESALDILQNKLYPERTNKEQKSFAKTHNRVDEVTKKIKKARKAQKKAMEQSISKARDKKKSYVPDSE